MEFLDNLWGFFNFFPKIAGALRTATWKSQARNRQQHSKWATVTLSFPRKDKGGRYNLDRVCSHLARYGVTVVSWNYDSKRWYVVVRKNQGAWAAKLLGTAATGGALWTPRKGWADD